MQNYRSGELLTGELKKQCIAVLQKIVKDFQEVSSSGHCQPCRPLTTFSQRRVKVTDEILAAFMDASRPIDGLAVTPPGSTVNSASARETTVDSAADAAAAQA